MSLLLDALKKAGQGPHQETGEQGMPRTADELTLEEHPDTEPAGTAPAQPQIQAQAKPRPDAARQAGKKMFAAKKLPIRGRVQMGIVPMALIGGAVFAAGYGTYLWYELTPHQQAVLPHPVVPVHQAPPPPSQPAPGR